MTSQSSGDLVSPWIEVEAADAQNASRPDSQDAAAMQLTSLESFVRPPGPPSRAPVQQALTSAGAAAEPSLADTGFLGRFAFNIVDSMVICPPEELHQPQHRAAIGVLVRRIKCALYLLALMWPFAAFLFGRGAAVFFGTRHAWCHSTWWTIWLVGFLVLQLASIFMIWVAPLLLLWTFAAVLLQVPRNCPILHDFFVQVLAVQGVQIAFFLGAVCVALSARPVLRRLQLAVGRTDPRVLDLIAVVDASEIASDDECAVCLSHETEDAEGSRSPWRQLICGHRFHEVCLLRWLEGAHRCPICRSDLRATYSEVGLEVDSSTAG